MYTTTIRPLLSRARARSPWTSSRHYLNAPPKPCYAFAFDIDGVLLRGHTPTPGASEALNLLKASNVPFVFLTNGGGKHEADRVEELSHLLDVEIREDMFVQSHTPFKELVNRYETVLAVGGPETGEGEGSGGGIYDVAKRYGFKNVHTPHTILHHYPEIWPFSVPKLKLPLNAPIPIPDKAFNAILVFNDPRHWGPTSQLLVDILLSEKGKLGTYESSNKHPHIDIWWSNSDLWWQAEYHLPRLGQGGFRATVEGIWRAATGLDLSVSENAYFLGKPHKATYDYTHRVLDKIVGRHVDTVYMVGDNPRSDIQGANRYGWHSLLVETGVFSEERDGGLKGLQGDLRPRNVLRSVVEAVEFGLKRGSVVEGGAKK